MSLLALRGLSKSFGGVRALDRVSFDVEAGEMLALIGPNGAGKSTCFNLLGGQLTADEGEIALAGKILVRPSARSAWQAGIGRTFQMASVFGTLTALENVSVAVLARERSLFRMVARVPRAVTDEARQLLGDVGLGARGDSIAATLAYGERKRLEFALALAARPRLLLMDEPTAGMAPAERHGLMEAVVGVARARGLAVLFTEHSLDVVFGFADRIVVLSAGAVIALGKPHEVRHDQRARTAYFGNDRP